MTQQELFSFLCQYVCNSILTFEEIRSMTVDEFHNWVISNFNPISKNKLEIGKEYKGMMRKNTSGYIKRAIWNGKNFICMHILKHYEDDTGDDNVFIPIEQEEE